MLTAKHGAMRGANLDGRQVEAISRESLAPRKRALCYWLRDAQRRRRIVYGIPLAWRAQAIGPHVDLLAIGKVAVAELRRSGRRKKKEQT